MGDLGRIRAVDTRCGTTANHSRAVVVDDVQITRASRDHESESGDREDLGLRDADNHRLPGPDAVLSSGLLDWRTLLPAR